MTLRIGRPRVLVAAVLAALLIVGIQAPPETQAHANLDRFLYALGQVESGGNYTARNPTSGAYGKYQIMPFNWAPWAGRYLGNPKAAQSPRNQEIVAREKVHELREWLGKWRRTAYWWLTGKTKTSGWSAHATRYVANVMAIYRRTSTKAAQQYVKRSLKAEVTARAPVAHRYADSSSAITYRGTWIKAEHRDYRGDAVRQAKRKGQLATMVFVGNRIAWNGPTGPTRGKAKVFIDGKYVKTVDLYAKRFDAVSRIFTKTFAKAARHRITIIVLGTRGRPVVAIDELIVWR